MPREHRRKMLGTCLFQALIGVAASVSESGAVTAAFVGTVAVLYVFLGRALRETLQERRILRREGSR